MKRCILVNCRTNNDKQTGDDLMFLTLYRLPTKMSNGGLWHPKANEAVINACINKTKKPEDYERFSKIMPGSLVDVTFGLNDFNNKTFVASLDLVKGTNVFNEEILYQ